MGRAVGPGPDRHPTPRRTMDLGCASRNQHGHGERYRGLDQPRALVWCTRGSRLYQQFGRGSGRFDGRLDGFGRQRKGFGTRPVPVYLDVAEALRTEGSCFTFPSPLLLALEEALRLRRDYAPLGSLVRQRLRGMGIEPMVEEPIAAPVVTTFVPPRNGFLDHCLHLGYRIGGESGYLAARGLVQIATMGAVQARHVDSLFDRLA
jgi:hypothetical protein